MPQTTGQLWPRGNWGSSSAGGSGGITVPPTSSYGTGPATLATVFGIDYASLKADDVIFFMAFNNSGNLGAMSGTNASGTVVAAVGFKGAAYGWVRFGSADTGNYGYASASHGHIWFVLRGLTNPANPVASSSSTTFYSGAISVPTVTVPAGGGSVLLMQFVGSGNRDAALTSMVPAMSCRTMLPITHYLGAWLTAGWPAGPTGAITMKPDGTGGGSGDSWCAAVALNGTWTP